MGATVAGRRLCGLQTGFKTSRAPTSQGVQSRRTREVRHVVLTGEERKFDLVPSSQDLEQ